MIIYTSKNVKIANSERRRALALHLFIYSNRNIEGEGDDGIGISLFRYWLIEHSMDEI